MPGPKLSDARRLLAPPFKPQAEVTAENLFAAITPAFGPKITAVD